MTRTPRDHPGLHVEAHGQGPDLLLTHGFGATCRMWDEQIEDFTDRFRLIVWDLPGHGQSAPPGGDLAPETLTDAMRAILDRRQTERAVLVGLGLGGLLSLRFARAHPERVRGLVLIGTAPGLREGPARDIWNAQATLLAEALEREGLPALEGGAEVDPRVHADAAGLAQMARSVLTQRDDGVRGGLRGIAAPTLVLVGGDDRPNLTAARHMAETMPNARAVVVPRANHAANLHKPDAVNAAIRAFLGRLGG